MVTIIIVYFFWECYFFLNIFLCPTYLIVGQRIFEYNGFLCPDGMDFATIRFFSLIRCSYLTDLCPDGIDFVLVNSSFSKSIIALV